LLALVDGGITREDAYVIVQRNAMAVWDDLQQARSGLSLKERLERDADVCLSAEQLDRLFDPLSFLERSDVLFERLEALEF
jgi:adenylosuccinate lyase